MATRKGLCPYCTTHRVERRIFPVNPEASTCFCPICMKEVEPKVAIEGYTELIKKMLLKADNTLFVTCDPVLAYSEYASVIELEPKEAHALLGRILCLIYMGKVRNSYLAEAYTLLENTSYEGCNIDEFIFFLKKINFALDEYESSLQKKLTFKTYFFDLECLKLYWLHLRDIIKMKEFILSIVRNIKKDYKSSQAEVIANMLEHNIDEKKKLLRTDAYTCDGVPHHYVKTLNGKVIVDKSTKRKKINTHLNRYRLSTLDIDEKHKRYIKDEIFKDYTRVVKSQKVALVFSIIFYLVMGGGVASTILFRDKPIFFYSFLGGSVFFFILATILLILSISWRMTLKKRRLRID